MPLPLAPPFPTGSTSTPAETELVASLRKTVLDNPHIEFELYGNQFRFRSSDRAGRKFKHKETIELWDIRVALEYYRIHSLSISSSDLRWLIQVGMFSQSLSHSSSILPFFLIHTLIASLRTTFLIFILWLLTIYFLRIQFINLFAAATSLPPPIQEKFWGKRTWTKHTRYWRW